MARNASSIGFRTHNPIFLETLLSVEDAARLQDISMKRFQAEAGSNLKLRRFLGHVSVNRRSTEIIKTAMFEDELMAEVEGQFEYDEDAIHHEIEHLHEEQSPQMDIPEYISEYHQARTTIPIMADESIMSESMAISSLEEYLPHPENMSAITEEDEIMFAMEEDWMYDILNLHIESDGISEPYCAPPIPRAVAIQIWKMILQSLAGFSQRKAQAEWEKNVSQLEAYGHQKQDNLVGLGLLCTPSQYQQPNSRIQLAS